LAHENKESRARSGEKATVGANPAQFRIHAAMLLE
jgi:hypothetical protein